jgi:hypothetical protein
MKKVISLMMIVLIGAALLVSCSGSPDSPTPTPTPTDPTYTPTLTSYNAKEVFAKGVTLEKAKASGYFGSLKYQDEKGDVTTVVIKDSTDVTIKGFDTATETGDDEVRTIVFQYKGLSVTTKYKVYELQIPAVKGTFVIGKNQTVTLDTVEDPENAVITTYKNYMTFYRYMWTGEEKEEGDVENKEVKIEYKFIADTNRVKIIIDGTAYASDGKGGLQSHVQDVDVLEPVVGQVYVSTEKFSNWNVPTGFGGKWLAFKVYDSGHTPYEEPTEYCWKFYLLDNQGDPIPANPTFQITADKLSFDNTGIYVDKKTDLDLPTYAVNFQAGPNRDSTYTEFKGLHVVSYADNDWKGYSCTLLPR